MLFQSSTARVTASQNGKELRDPKAKVYNFYLDCVRGLEVEVEFVNLTSVPVQVALTDFSGTPQFVPVAANGTHVFRFTPTDPMCMKMEWGTRNAGINFMIIGE